MMKLSTSTFMLLICTAALLSTTEGSTKPINLRCECIQTYSGPAIPFGKIQSLRMIPAGPKCKNEEIIFNQKNVTSRP
ncbi:hypothetical protein cypCar_00030038 [Cyprinus carpio]|nr:hypothetical protein cypCar_00030038 [Cyprinus carpio]